MNAKKLWSIFAVTCASGVSTLPAITIANYSATANNRFASGFNTESPVLNTSPTFVGAGYDWSGIGWNTSSGDSLRVQSFAMLSPVAAYSASHYSLTQVEPGNSNRTAAEFVNSSGKVVHATLFNTVAPVISGGDIRITKIIHPLAVSDGIAVMRVLDVSSGNYAGQPAFMVGSVMSGNTTFATGPLVATAKIASTSATQVSVTSYFSDTSLSFQSYESGDSGSPILIPYKGQLTIAGAAWFGNGSGSTLLGTTPATASIIPPVNAVLAADGYAMKWTIYDVPADTANTAARWKGSAGTGAFGTASNWTSGGIPNNLPVVFDAAGANGQTAITLGADRTLRGMLFIAGGTSGFTFASGNTLTVGSTGIRNESTFAQTFNGNIALGNSQNWEAANGDLIFNGNIANSGFLTVVGGAMNTTIAGVVSGVGGLAKDDAGILTLSGANTYTGLTWIHNGTLKLGSSSALSASTRVIFDTLNPNATLDLNGRSVTITDLNSGNGLPSNLGSGIVKMSGGSLSIGSASLGNTYKSTYAGSLVGSGTITKTGLGTLVLAGDGSGFSGNVNVNGGKLAIKGVLGAGPNAVSVKIGTGSSAAMFSGNATINGSVVLNNMATLAPSGDSLRFDGYMEAPAGTPVSTMHVTGGLVWNGGGEIKMRLENPLNADLIDLGSAGFTKGLAGTYNFNFFNQGSWINGSYVFSQWTPGTYTLLTFGSTTFNAADFTFSPIANFTGTFAITGNALTFQLQSTQTIQSVPEPSTSMLVILGTFWCAFVFRERFIKLGRVLLKPKN